MCGRGKRERDETATSGARRQARKRGGKRGAADQSRRRFILSLAACLSHPPAHARMRSSSSCCCRCCSCSQAEAATAAFAGKSHACLPGCLAVALCCRSSRYRLRPVTQQCPRLLHQYPRHPRRRTRPVCRLLGRTTRRTTCSVSPGIIRTRRCSRWATCSSSSA